MGSGGVSEEGSAAEQQVPNLTIQAVDGLDRLLNDGRLIPGQRLIETDLCELLELGRVPVREALRILAGDGVIELVPGRGARVRRMGPRQIVEMLKVIVGMLFVALDDFPQGDGQSAAKSQLIAANDAIARALLSHDYVKVNEALCNYQLMLIDMSGNDYLRFSMKRVHFTYYTRQVISYVDIGQVYKVAAPYPAITEALLKGDVESARALFRVARDAVISSLENAIE